MILGTSLVATGCAGIKVQVETACYWARMAPELTEDQTTHIVGSNIDNSTLEALNELDNFVEKHNELFTKYCS